MGFNFWQLLGGIGLFLYGMHLLEQSLNMLASREFKLLLQRQTSKNARAVLSGILTTTVLQSSSIVSYLTLAFVGSGIIQLQNALALILGANIGSTAYNWIVATFGFKLNFENIWFPVLGLAGIAITLFGKKEKIRNICRFLIGFSFLFLALEFMKDSMAGLAGKVDLAAYSRFSPAFFVMLGFLITFLVQSSAATMAITLSALYSGVIPFHLAAAIVIGSEPGTAFKLILGALGSSPTKKRVALGNILFNVVTAIIALIFLGPLLNLVTHAMHIGDPLIGLVSFQTLINIMALILFFPLLSPFGKWLQRFYKDSDRRSTIYIEENIPDVTEFALDIFKLEVYYFIKRVLYFNTSGFQLEPEETGLNRLFTEREWAREKTFDQVTDHYGEIKHAEGEIIEYYIQLQKESLSHGQLSFIHHLINTVHSAMHSAKSFKDISHNNQELLKSANDYKFNQFAVFRGMVGEVSRETVALLQEKGKGSPFNELYTILQKIQQDYDAFLNRTYEEARKGSLPEKDLATLLNMNREIYSGQKALIYAVSEFILEPKQAEDFKNIPLDIR